MARSWGQREALEPPSRSTAPPAACSSSSGNPKPAGLWHSTSPLPVEEDGFHQGDHIPARVVPGAHNRNVQELPRDKWCFFETGDTHTPPPQDPVSNSLGLCYGERLHNPALPLGKETQTEVGVPWLRSEDQEAGRRSSCLTSLSGETRHSHPPAVAR